MRLPLRGLADAALRRSHGAARSSLDAFGRATQRHGSLIRSWVGGATVLAQQRYPAGGVVDDRRGSQFFYHCHRAGDGEHGHLHLFWHATRSGRRRRLAPLPPGAPDARWTHSAPSHLVSIGLDARGLPVSVYTVNQWVTGGYWFDADTTLRMLRRFALHGIPGHGDSCAWLTAFVRLYEPVLARVLQARDRAVRARGARDAVLADRRLEVVSTARLDWADDLQRIETEMQSRGLDAAS